MSNETEKIISDIQLGIILIIICKLAYIIFTIAIGARRHQFFFILQSENQTQITKQFTHGWRTLNVKQPNKTSR